MLVPVENKAETFFLLVFLALGNSASIPCKDELYADSASGVPTSCLTMCRSSRRRCERYCPAFHKCIKNSRNVLEPTARPELATTKEPALAVITRNVLIIVAVGAAVCFAICLACKFCKCYKCNIAQNNPIVQGGPRDIVVTMTPDGGTRIILQQLETQNPTAMPCEPGTSASMVNTTRQFQFQHLPTKKARKEPIRTIYFDESSFTSTPDPAGTPAGDDVPVLTTAQPQRLRPSTKDGRGGSMPAPEGNTSSDTNRMTKKKKKKKKTVSFYVTHPTSNGDVADIAAVHHPPTKSVLLTPRAGWAKTSAPTAEVNRTSCGDLTDRSSAPPQAAPPPPPPPAPNLP